MIAPVASLEAMAPYVLADLPDGLVSLAQNEGAFPPSAAAHEAGRAAVERSGPYCDPDWRALRAAIAQTYAVDPDDVLCGAGSMELIGAAIRAFAGPGDAVLGSAHGYLFPATAAAQSGARYDTAPEADYCVSIDALLEAVRPETRVVIVCNPGNPTGTRIPNAEIVRLRHAMPDGVLLLVDQAYAEFDEQSAKPIFELVAEGRTVVTRTFSKAYCLADARVGWGVFPPDLARQIRKLLNPNNIAGVSQAMAAAAVRDELHLRRVVRQTAQRRDQFAGALRAGGYEPPESRTNFILIPFRDVAEAARADGALRDGGFLLRGVAGYGLGHCLRATIGDAEAMRRVAEIVIDMRRSTHVDG